MSLTHLTEWFSSFFTRTKTSPLFLAVTNISDVTVPFTFVKYISSNELFVNKDFAS